MTPRSIEFVCWKKVLVNILRLDRNCQDGLQYIQSSSKRGLCGPSCGKPLESSAVKYWGNPKVQVRVCSPRYGQEIKAGSPPNSLCPTSTALHHTPMSMESIRYGLSSRYDLAKASTQPDWARAPGEASFSLGGKSRIGRVCGCRLGHGDQECWEKTNRDFHLEILTNFPLTTEGKNIHLSLLWPASLI